MPIGKNAINRVGNNGYSNVESKAPDMENSTIIANPNEQVIEKIVKPIEKKATKTKTQPKPKTKAIKTENGFERVSVGEDLPYYLM